MGWCREVMGAYFREVELVVAEQAARIGGSHEPWVRDAGPAAQGSETARVHLPRLGGADAMGMGHHSAAGETRPEPAGSARRAHGAGSEQAVLRLRG